MRDPRTLLPIPTDPAKAKALAAAIEASKLDWTHSGYIGPMFLYFFYGFFDGKLLRPSQAHNVSMGADKPLSLLADIGLLVHGLTQ